MKLLVTGGSGFIGTNLIESCLNNSVDFINVDWNAPLNSKHHDHWVYCDILDKGNLLRIFQDYQPTHVVHLAARADCEESEDLNGYLQNTEGVRNVLEVIRATPSVQRVIMTSSQFVCKAGHLPKHDEDYNPFTLYGVSKVLTEQYTRSANLSCAWTIIRPTTIWGPWSLRYRDVLFKVLRSGLYFHPSKKRVIRSYGYVNNVIYQINQILTIDEEKVNKKVFYVGDQPFNLKDWVDLVSLNLTGRTVRVIPTPVVKTISRIGDVLAMFRIRFPITTRRFNSMVSDYITPVDAAIDVLGEPPYSIEAGVMETCNWYRTDSATVIPHQPDIPRPQEQQPMRENRREPEPIQVSQRVSNMA